MSQLDDDASLICRTMDVKCITNLLRTMHFQEECTVVAESEGLKFAVDQAGCLQAKVFFQSTIFDEYLYGPDEPISFKISLAILLDCLGIFGTGGRTAMRLSYSGYGAPLVLMLEEGGVMTDCSIKTLDIDDTAEIDLRATDIPSNIIMKSAWLAEVFSELDMTSELLEIHISPDQPYFRLTTDGFAGSSQVVQMPRHVECPKESDVVESFTCRKTLVNRYRLKQIKTSEKALAQSSKISIRINGWGILSMQFLCHSADGQVIFIEFVAMPEDDTGDAA